jgi:hypothetical protein
MIRSVLVTIPWRVGEVACAGPGPGGPESIRELSGLCTGLLGRRPLGASLLTEGIDRGIEGGEEVIRIEWADEFVALELRSDGVLEFGEHKRGATGVEFLVEVADHAGPTVLGRGRAWSDTATMLVETR